MRGRSRSTSTSTDNDGTRCVQLSSSVDCVSRLGSETLGTRGFDPRRQRSTRAGNDARDATVASSALSLAPFPAPPACERTRVGLFSSLLLESTNHRHLAKDDEDDEDDDDDRSAMMMMSEPTSSASMNHRENGTTSALGDDGDGRSGGRSGGRRGRAKTLALDATLFAATVGIGGWLEVATPNQKYIQEDLLWRYSYPHGENTVPTVVVPLIAFFVPLACMALLPKKFNPNMRRERAIGGLCASVGMTWLVTSGMKNVIGGIRPDFVDRCWPDGNKVWVAPGVPNCSGDNDSVQQGRRSFPSGHTSMSFSGFVYCSLYLAAWLRIGRPDRAMGRWEGVWKLAAVLAPTVLAAFVGLTRIRDYWHHWEDVLVGAALGTGFACLSWWHKKPYVDNAPVQASSFVNYHPLDDEATS